VIPRNPDAPHSDPSQKDPETLDRLEVSRDRTGKKGLRPIHQRKHWSAWGLARRLRRVVENSQSWWEASQLQKRCNTYSPSFELHIGQRLSTRFEICPLQTFMATALCQHCYISIASLRALALVQTSPQTNLK
jgi:hypothetical protein